MLFSRCPVKLFDMVFERGNSVPNSTDACLYNRQKLPRQIRTYTLFVRSAIFLVTVLSFAVPTQAWNWGDSDGTDLSDYGNTFQRSYLYDGSSSISMKIDGCLWSIVDDGEDAGCMEDESEDGTSYWYQMANCKRANVAFSLYSSGSSSKTSCNSGYFRESFVTKTGFPEFLSYMAQYDQNNPFGDSNGDNNNGERELVDGYSYDSLPNCEESDNGYIGVACGNDGSFVLDYFNDAYCLQRTGETYNYLSQLNKVLKYYKNCASVYTSGDDSNVAQKLVTCSESCSSLDSSYCEDDSNMSNRRSNSGSTVYSSRNGGWMNSASKKTWASKLKFGLGSVLLFASFIMFTGILFTNRRRRRALMQRKFRQSSDKSKKSSRSKSRSRDERSRKSSKSKRSKSRSKRTGGDTGGVFT